MSKKRQQERHSLLIATAALAILILTGLPSEITIEKPITIISVVCYAAAAIVLIVEWIRHFLRYRNTEE